MMEIFVKMVDSLLVTFCQKAPSYKFDRVLNPSLKYIKPYFTDLKYIKSFLKKNLRDGLKQKFTHKKITKKNKK